MSGALRGMGKMTASSVSWTRFMGIPLLGSPNVEDKMVKCWSFIVRMYTVVNVDFIINILELLSILSWPILVRKYRLKHYFAMLWGLFYPIDKNLQICPLNPGVVVTRAPIHTRDLQTLWYVKVCQVECLESPVQGKKAAGMSGYHTREISGTSNFFTGCKLTFLAIIHQSEAKKIMFNNNYGSYVATLWFIRFNSYPILPSCHLDDDYFSFAQSDPIIPGCTLYQQTQVVYLLSYYGLMLPAGYALAFHYGCGVKGIW